MILTVNVIMAMVWAFTNAFSVVSGYVVRLFINWRASVVSLSAAVLAALNTQADYWRNRLVRFQRLESGQIGTGFIVTALVIVLIAVNLVPTIVTQISDATGVGGALEGTDVAPLFDFLPLIVTIGIVLVILRRTGVGGGS